MPAPAAEQAWSERAGKESRGADGGLKGGRGMRMNDGFKRKREDKRVAESKFGLEEERSRKASRE
eukprot:1541320-Pleurochrysis_carterae.AAC.2